MNIQVSEWGWGFVLECFKRFQGEGVFYLFFAAALIWMSITGKKESWKWPALGYFVCLMLTIFNPLIVTPIIRILGLDDEFYRLIWLLPFTVIIAWVVTEWIGRCKTWWNRGIVLVILIVVLAIPGKSILARGLTFAENIYKVPDELIEICEIIHQDSDEEEPKAALDFDLVVLMGQYDPSIKMALTYSDFFYMEWQRQEDYKSWFPPDLMAQMDIYRVLYNGEMLGGKDMRGALECVDTKYVVVKKQFSGLEYLYTQDLILLGETANYVILMLKSHS